ncbi:peptide deformylase [Conexibacter arvalis]|uniref:Peptide deformylase n=1 Tax=Conexibacter arvalis TaxID=912552 RepID=A0A840IDG0_9ACTN|nr:peptide deformylase [Conexibacter arvalis]MBB4662802.1 peptide deformylase [Conexibacter arvalis]
MEHDDEQVQTDGRAGNDARQQAAAAARRRSALAQLRHWGDPVLRATASEVSAFDGELRAQAARMGEVMVAADGAGLAAPQVGSLRRLFVYRFTDTGPARAIVNPRLTWVSPERQRGYEGCLSIQGIAVAVERAAAVTMTGRDLDGGELTIDAEGPDAVVLQHELDHLDGILMLDRADRDERRRAMRELRERAAAG